MFSLPEGTGMQEGKAGREPSFGGSRGLSGAPQGFGAAVAAKRAERVQRWGEGTSSPRHPHCCSTCPADMDYFND